MIVLLFIALISFIAFMFSSIICYSDHTSRIFFPSLIASCVSLAIFITSLATVLFGIQVTANGAETVAVVIEENSDKSLNNKLYYDTEREQYFTVDSSLWNPFKTAYRNYVDAETAKMYVKVYNQLAEITLE